MRRFAEDQQAVILVQNSGSYQRLWVSLANLQLFVSTRSTVCGGASTPCWLKACTSIACYIWNSNRVIGFIDRVLRTILIGEEGCCPVITIIWGMLFPWAERNILSALCVRGQQSSHFLRIIQSSEISNQKMRSISLANRSSTPSLPGGYDEVKWWKVWMLFATNCTVSFQNCQPVWFASTLYFGCGQPVNDLLDR